MSKSKVFTAVALAAAAALGLAACGTAEGPQTGADSLANGAVTVPANCTVTAYLNSVKAPYSSVTYDFHYGMVNLTNVNRGYSQSFNNISNPRAQAEITAAHALLPASANCAAPVFAPAAPAAPAA